MFLGKKPARLAPTAKSRLNTHPHNLECSQDSKSNRKKSPDGSQPPGPPSPSEVLVFNTQSGSSSRAGHYNNSLPEVPNIEEMYKWNKDNWDERMARINDPKNKLNVLWIKSFAEEEREREEAAKEAASAAATGATPSPAGSVSFASAVASPNTSTSGTSSNPLSRTNSNSNSSSPASASSSTSSTPTASSSSTQPKSKGFSPQHTSKSNR